MTGNEKHILREGWISIVANLFLFIGKYYAGIVTGSLALTADAWHTLSDSASSVAVVIGGKVSQKPADKDHPFGHGRAEHIASIIIGLLLALIAANFFTEAVRKLGSREHTHFGALAITITIISIIVKEALAQYAFWAARKANANILRADGWHHRSDALSSVIILGGILFGNVIWWMDAALSFIVAIMIGWTSYSILSSDIKSLLGESPSDELLKEICETTQGEFSYPIHLHHIHLHNYGRHTELSCHIKLPPTLSLVEAHEVCTKVEETIMKNFGYISTVHAEPLEEISR